MSEFILIYQSPDFNSARESRKPHKTEHLYKVLVLAGKERIPLVLWESTSPESGTFK